MEGDTRQGGSFSFRSKCSLVAFETSCWLLFSKWVVHFGFRVMLTMLGPSDKGRVIFASLKFGGSHLPATPAQRVPKCQRSLHIPNNWILKPLPTPKMDLWGATSTKKSDTFLARSATQSTKNTSQTEIIKSLHHCCIEGSRMLGWLRIYIGRCIVSQTENTSHTQRWAIRYRHRTDRTKTVHKKSSKRWRVTWCFLGRRHRPSCLQQATSNV